jgi:hypothetical protein
MNFLSQTQKDEIVVYVNTYRAKNQAPPMTWNEQVYGVSQAWSQYLASNTTLQHSGNANYGENLAFFQGHGTDEVELIKKAIDTWYSEVALYDFSNPAFSETTGHFTCLVWAASTSFAIGIAFDKSNNAYITMNTSPPGNYVGQFKDNVLPLLGAGSTQLSGPGASAPLPAQFQTHKRIIFQDLANIVYAINTNKPKATVISIINNIVQKLNSYPAF